MKVAIVQFDMTWEDIPANLNRLYGIIEKASEADLIVLPEMFTTGFTMHATEMAETMNGQTVQQMKSWAAETDALIMGSIIVEEDGHYYNRMIAAHPNQDIQTYDKRHRFTFAGEDQHYSAGSEDVDIIQFKGWRILPQICYDVRFPVFSRYSESRAYDLMVYVANFPNKRISAWTHLLKARAIENQAYVVGVNRYGLDGLGNYYNGESQVIDYSGKTIVMLSPGEWVEYVELDLQHLEKFRQNFPFLKDRDLT